jgi:hypothetical protein
MPLAAVDGSWRNTSASSRSSVSAALVDRSTVPNVRRNAPVELIVDTPADTYRSGNSVFTCLARSGFSMGC